MLIKEVCEKCSLTKKAVEYYEKQGLVHPKVSKNGYRNYDDMDVLVLKEISVLRSLGLSISAIKDILSSNNKSIALMKYKYLMEVKMERAAAQQERMEKLIENYDIDKELEFMESNLDSLFTIKEKLVDAFPGTYGMFLSIHFGPFLNETIDSPEKAEACSNIIEFLDNVVGNTEIAKELEDQLESFFPLMEKEEMEKLNYCLLEAVKDTDYYIENHKESLEEYIKFRTSEEYKSTSAYKMQQLFLKFQQSNGYYEGFIPNLKILSSSYREYVEKLEEANKLFIERYPEMGNLNQKD